MVSWVSRFDLTTVVWMASLGQALTFCFACHVCVDVRCWIPCLAVVLWRAICRGIMQWGWPFNTMEAGRERQRESWKLRQRKSQFPLVRYFFPILFPTRFEGSRSELDIVGKKIKRSYCCGGACNTSFHVLDLKYDSPFDSWFSSRG